MSDDHEHHWVPFESMIPRFDAEAAAVAATGPIRHTLVRVCSICTVQRPW